MENPAFDYDGQEHDYKQVRRADPRIAAYVRAGLEGCATVVNIGAGTGSYEPEDTYVISVEPSEKMRRDRLALGRRPALKASADRLPFDDGSFDASLAILTVHHWPDLEAGLLEMRRVSRRRMVILTYDPDRLEDFWNARYFPELIAAERKRYPDLGRIEAILGMKAERTVIRIPLDCTDGFQEAFSGRPEGFLEDKVRRAQSAWGFISKQLESEYISRLRSDLESGEWDGKYGHHRTLGEYAGAFRMLVFERSRR
jgi:SAM-dependent methyltransferase